MEVSSHRQNTVQSRSTVRLWIILIAASIVFHLGIVLTIQIEVSPIARNSRASRIPMTLILKKAPKQPEHIPEPVPIQIQKEFVENPVLPLKDGKPSATAQVMKRDKSKLPIQENKAKERKPVPPVPTRKEIAQESKPVQHPSPTQSRMQAMKEKSHPAAKPDSPKTMREPTDEKIQPPAPRDWHDIAKDVIRENIEKETLRDRQQEELGRKSPSVMYGKPKDYLDKQDKKAMLADTDILKEKNILPKLHRKSPGIGMKVGKSCFLGFTPPDEDGYKTAEGVSHAVSSIPFSCGF
ncbi:MAG: hypothetical protein PHE55_07030 [Methylococcaceae bacterium]|nr:hypothetical protein [Methylococcaceae bacterium]